MLYHRVAGRFYNRPLLLTPSAADTISSFLLSRIASGAEGPDMRRGGGGEDDARDARTFFPAQAGGDGSVTVHSPAASRFYGETPMSEDGTRRPLPFRRTAEGVAIVTMVGELVNRGGWVGASSGLISYEGFKYQLDQLARDPRTKAVLLDMESPGGEAVGAFEAAAAVRALAAVKPVWALVNGLCASAAYAIASAATRIVSIPTGITGSIGVVLAHFDYSEFLKEEGIKPTFIHAGAHKVDANPYQPLPDAVRERLQGEVESFYDLFVQTVAAGRSGLSEKAIRGTQALTFMGADALAAGLVDELGSFEGTLAKLNGGAAASTRTRSAASTSPTSSSAIAGTTRSNAMTDQEADAVRAEERARFKSILGAPEAQGREKQAQALAFDTSLAPATAIAIMAASPRETGASAFLAEKEGRAALNLDPDTTQLANGGPAAIDEFWSGITSSLNAKAGLKDPVR